MFLEFLVENKTFNFLKRALRAVSARKKGLKKVLRIIYDESNSKFEDFLTTDSSFIIHHQNIQTLEIEMFKIHQGFSQISFLDENNFYSLRSQPDFQIPRIKTSLKGAESVRYLGPVIWNNIPIEIRSIKNLGKFKTEIRQWKPKNS